MKKNYSGLVIMGIFLSVVLIVHFLLFWVFKSDKSLYYNIAVSIIISWLAVLIGYYVWAIQFYNIDKGKTEEHRQAIAASIAAGNASADDLENPHMEETLGLPAGTVRGTIALSLVVAGLALGIASLSMDSSIVSGKILVDNFEFLKNAFLMMIAFYFGAKSLEVLNKQNNAANAQTASPSTPPATPAGDNTGTPPTPSPTPSSNTPVINDIATGDTPQSNFTTPDAKE